MITTTRQPIFRQLLSFALIAIAHGALLGIFALRAPSVDLLPNWLLIVACGLWGAVGTFGVFAATLLRSHRAWRRWARRSIAAMFGLWGGLYIFAWFAGSAALGPLLMCMYAFLGLAVIFRDPPDGTVRGDVIVNLNGVRQHDS